MEVEEPGKVEDSKKAKTSRVEISSPKSENRVERLSISLEIS